MDKHKLIPIAAAAFVLMGGAVAGMGKLAPSLVHAQAPAIQVQQTTPKKGEVLETQGKESVETNEPAGEQAQEKNLPGGEHQDTGQADHQFEGAE